MKRRYSGRPARPTAISRTLERTNADLQAMETIRRMLAAGAEATPFGARATLRLPGEQTSKEFPAELVERVKAEPMGCWNDR